MNRYHKQVKPANLNHPEFYQVKWQYDLWLNGRSKNDIERLYYHDPRSHGKLMTHLFREVLGIETERPHPLQDKLEQAQLEIKELRRIIEEKNQTIKKLMVQDLTGDQS